MRPTLADMLIGYTHLAEVVRSDADQFLLSLPESTEDIDAQDLIPMPVEDAPEARVGDQFKVFVHSDSRGFPVATADQPMVQRGQCATLKVADITNAGAFLDWGLKKHLLLPYAEQRRPVETGHHESVLVYLDNSGRLAASSRIDHHLTDEPEGFSPWQSVSLLIFQRTDLGFKAVVEDRAVGLLYRNEIFQPIRVGDRMSGFVKQIRNDGRLDLALQQPNRLRENELPERILDWLKQHDGVGTLTDRSDPEEIMATFQVSKKNYKKALSALYRERQILIEPSRIVLVGHEAD